MDETILGDNKDDSIFMADLHSNREVINSFCREKDFNGFLLEGRVSFSMIDFDNLKL
jgi:hypothetical protein